MKQFDEYTEDLLGMIVTVNDDGVVYQDEIIEVYLPSGDKIIGPSITCAKIYARWFMVADMLQKSEMIKKMIDEQGV